MLPPRRPRLVLTTWRALAIATACCGTTAWGGHVLFAYVEHVRGCDDARDEQASLALVVAMLACWLASVVLILRSRRGS